MARTDTLSNESKQALAEAEADANREADEQRMRETDIEEDDFSPTSLASPFALPPTLARDSAPKNARSEAQIAVDAVVKDAYSKWLAAGEPRTWPLIVSTGCVAGYWVKPANVDKIQKMVKFAGVLHRVSIRMGRPAPRADDMPQDGRVFVNFAVLTTIQLSEETKANMRAARANRAAASAS
jgi:hypothetical protein